MEWSIKQANCDLCDNNAISSIKSAASEFPSLFEEGTTLFRQPKDTVVEALFWSRVHELRAQAKEQCFLVQDDCGDSLAICQQCLKNILSEFS